MKKLNISLLLLMLLTFFSCKESVKTAEKTETTAEKEEKTSENGLPQAFKEYTLLKLPIVLEEIKIIG